MASGSEYQLILEHHFGPYGAPAYPTKWYHPGLSKAAFNLVYHHNLLRHFVELYFRPNGLSGAWFLGAPSMGTLPLASPLEKISRMREYNLLTEFSISWPGYLSSYNSNNEDKPCASLEVSESSENDEVHVQTKVKLWLVFRFRHLF